MGPAFTLRSSDKRISLEMSRPSVVYRNDERFNSYIVILRGDPVTAGQGLLDNDVYLWAEFFEEIASQKANWSGAKYHESDGGILRMKCTETLRAESICTSLCGTAWRALGSLPKAPSIWRSTS